MKAYVITIEGHDKSEAAAHRCIKSGLKNGIKIENSLMDLYMDGYLNLSSFNNEPLKYSGELNIIEGSFFYNGNEFTNIEGNIYLEPTNFNPELNIYGSTNIAGEEIDVAASNEAAEIRASEEATASTFPSVVAARIGVVAKVSEPAEIARVTPCTNTSVTSPVEHARWATPTHLASVPASVMTIFPAVSIDTRANSVIASAATKLTTIF